MSYLLTVNTSYRVNQADLAQGKYLGPGPWTGFAPHQGVLVGPCVVQCLGKVFSIRTLHEVNHDQAVVRPLSHTLPG